MKILLLSPDQLHRYNWGHQLWRNDLANHHEVVYYGAGYKDYNAKRNTNDIIQQHNDSDIIFTYGYKYTLPFGNFIVPSHMKRVHLIVDLFPAHPAGYAGAWDKYKTFLSQTQFDLLFVRQRIQMDYLKKMGCEVPTYWLPFSVNTDIYKNQGRDKIYDVFASATMRDEVYPNRRKINALLRRSGLRVITGKSVIRDAYIEAINQSKIGVISVNVFASPNMKFTEFTSCGTFVLADRPADFNHLGFKDGKHLVLYENLDDLSDKIKYFLKHEVEREEIAKNGMEFVRKNHNNTVRSKQFTDAIRKEFNI